MKEILVDPAADRHILDFRSVGFRDIAVLDRYQHFAINAPKILVLCED